MANIIRCKLPDGLHRFSPFLVKDYRDFLLIRNDMETKDEDEQADIVNELAEEYFPSFPKTWQQYIFLNVFTGSIGKTKIPIVFKCPICGKSQKRLFNISQPPLKAPEIKLSDSVTLRFKFPEIDQKSFEQLILDNIETVVHENEEYAWETLDQSTKDSIIDLIDINKFETIVKSLKPIHFELTVKCCDTQKLVYDNLFSIFKLLINPDEVFPFYEINSILIKNGYDQRAIMEMLPAERSIALSLIEKDSKK